jgi:hypothetical protein
MAYQLSRLILLAFLPLFLAGCESAAEKIDAAFGNTRIVEVPVPVKLQITVTTPQTNQKNVGYSAKVGGACAPAGTAVVVDGDGSGLGVCGLNNTWEVEVDFRKAPVGAVKVHAYLVNGDQRSTRVTKVLNKTTTDCDSEEALNGVFASASAPWAICTAAQLDNIRNDLNANYVIRNDIDMKSIPFSPIPANFRGKLDGGGFVLDGLYIAQAGMSDVGLFKRLSDTAEVKDLTLRKFSVTGASQVGGLAGRVIGNNIKISRVDLLDGSVMATTSGAGGLVGYMDAATNLTIEDSNVVSSRISALNYAGGVVAYSSNTNSRLVASRVTASGTVVGNTNVGGIVGALLTPVNHELTDIESEMALTATGNFVGGIAGSLVSGSIERCAYRAEINTDGSSYVGGVVGDFSGDSIKHCEIHSRIRASASANAASYVGGIVGRFYNASISSGGLVDSEFDGTLVVSGVNESNYTGGAVGDFRGQRLQRVRVSGKVTNATGNPILLAQTGGSYIGGVAGRMIAEGNGVTEVSEVSSSAELIGMTYYANSYVGGFSGLITTTTSGGGLMRISDCEVSGSVTGTNNYVAGFAGSIYAERTGGRIDIENSHVRASSKVVGLQWGHVANVSGEAVRLQSYTGGFAGRITTLNNTGFPSSDGVYIQNSSNSAHVSGQGSYIGGFAAYVATGLGSGNVGGTISFTDIRSSGNVDNSSLVNGTGDYAGGLIGYVAATTYSSVLFSGNISARGNVTGNRNYVGGLIGYINFEADSTPGLLQNLSSGEPGGAGDRYVSLSGHSVGGLIGYASASGNSRITVSDSRSYGHVEALSDGFVGGLIGQDRARVSILSSEAHGNVVGRGNFVGGLAGGSDYSDRVYSDVKAYGSVTAEVSSVISSLYVGGLSGRLVGAAPVERASAMGNVTVKIVDAGSVTSAYTGGLIGSSQSLITESFATGNVQVENYGAGVRNYVGGLLGYGTGGVSSSFAMGRVQGYSFVGGLAGYLRGGLSNSFAAGDVTGNIYVGGLVGDYNLAVAGEVNRVYSVGALKRIAGSSTVTAFGSLIGRCSGDALVSRGFYNSETSTVDSAVTTPLVNCNSSTVNESRALSSAQMRQEASFTGFDFAGSGPSAWRFPVHFRIPGEAETYPYPIPYWVENGP